MSDDENLYAPEVPRYSFDDTETIILNAASQREDGMVLPIPESITASQEQVRRKLKRLIREGLLQEISAKLEDGLWRKDKDDCHLTLKLTPEGRRALNIFDEGPGLAQPEGTDRSNPEGAGVESTSKRDMRAAHRPRKAGTRPIPAHSETPNASQHKSASPTKTRSIATKKTPKTAVKKGNTQRSTTSKGAQLLAALGRAKGATLEELMKLSGWQAHSVRGFLSGTVKKKLKLKLRTEVDGKGVRRYCVARRRISS